MQHFERLFEYAPDALVQMDQEGCIALVNRQAERMFGYDRSELLGRTIDVLVPAPARFEQPLFGERLTTVGDDEPDVPHRELRARRKDGTEVALEVTVTLIDTGGQRMVLAALREVSARPALDRRLEQVHRLESVGKLAAGVAHDFNNLLTVILGTVELNLHDPALDRASPLYADLEAVRHAGTQAAALTQQLLAFSRKQVLQPRQLDLNMVVDATLGLMRRLLGEDITVICRTIPAVSGVLADPGQLQQVLMNLAANARDAMPRGGMLTITIEHVELDARFAAEHPSVKPGPHVRLAIRDTGVGLDEATRAKVFEPFFTTKAAGKGTGLGLATVYGIVKQSGGSIWVTSELNQGTTFTIYLPRLEDVCVAPEPDDASVTRSGAGGTILLVEDEPLVRQFAERVLLLHGYRVLSAADGVQALALMGAAAQPIDLLLTDVVMPNMSGPELAKNVSAVRPGIRVLYASGYTDEAMWNRSTHDPTGHFLHKPYTDRTLARKVDDVLSGQNVSAM